MRFLYKIWSGYDGFTPRRIPERRDPKNRLILGWTHYIDMLEPGAEVWVYFHWQNRYERGVYVKGFVDEIDDARQQVYLRVREHSTGRPLTDERTNGQVAEAVAQRNRQVFYLPETLLPPVADCTLENCKAGYCERCERWRSIPLVAAADLRRPSRLPSTIRDFVPGFWVVPSRCFLWREGASVSRAIQAGSDMFYRFKAGEARLAYPLARGIYDALSARGTLDFDCIVPIPLSTDKASSGELHRTLTLARELGQLLGVRAAEILTLHGPISKRKLRNAGVSMREFERRYLDLLTVDDRIGRYDRVLLVDDVCDHGSTMRCAVERLLYARPGLEVTCAAAAQMIVKEAVRQYSRLVA